MQLNLFICGLRQVARIESKSRAVVKHKSMVMVLKTTSKVHNYIHKRTLLRESLRLSPLYSDLDVPSWIYNTVCIGDETKGVHGSFQLGKVAMY